MKSQNSEKTDEIYGELSGLFPHLWNEAAFFDKVVVAVWGERRKRATPRIEGEGSFAIGGPGSFYARCIRRCHSISGNTLQVKYGPMRKFRNVSPFVLTLWANRSPVTCADVLLVLDGLMRRGYKAVLSSVELTFDTQNVPLWRFGREVCTRARAREVCDQEGRNTLYFGGPASPWQLRIYEKAYYIVRVEVILRSTFLRVHGIRRPQDLLLLRTENVWRHVAFRQVDPSAGYALPARVREPWLRRGLTLPPAMPACIIERALREANVDPSRWVIRSPRETLLRKMQENLVW